MPAFSDKFSFNDWLRQGESRRVTNVRWASKPAYFNLSKVIQHLIPQDEYAWFGGNSVEEIEDHFCYPDYDGEA